MATLKMLDKFARNCEQLGLTVTRDADTVVIDNGANDLTISLVDASILKPMGGVDPAVSPFLGIGVAAPCTIKVKSVVHAADTVVDVIDSAIAAQVFRVVAGFANDVTLENGDAGYVLTLRGSVDLIGMGQ